MLVVAILIGHQGGFKPKSLYVAPSLLLQEIFAKKGVTLVRVSTKNFSKKSGKFRQYFLFDQEGNTRIIKKPIKPDVIWQRINDGHLFIHTLLSPLYPIIPSYTTTTLAADKYETYLHTKEFSPFTVLLKHFLKSSTIQDKFEDMIVLKPIRANGGAGIFFMKKDELIKQESKYAGLDSLYIVQEFKDFSKGYPGLVKGIHDLRLVYVGKKLSFCTIRQPEKGSLKSNIASGGSQISIDLSSIPPEILSMSTKAQKDLFLGNDSIYSLDFAYCKAEGRRYLLEMNFSPGIRFPEKDKKWAITYFTDLSSFFKRIIRHLGHNY